MQKTVEKFFFISVRRHLYVRDMIAENVVIPEVVASADNRSDIFTKPLPRKPFQKLRNEIMGHIP